MTTPSPGNVRSEVLDLLNEMVLKAMGLKESLDDERKALESQDLHCIERAATSKNSCSEHIQHLDQKRQDLLASSGFDAGDDSMDQLIDWCDDGDVLRQRWDRLMMIAAQSHALNMTNGAIIRVRQQQFETHLSVLRGMTPGVDTYGRSGGDAGGFGHRSLARA